MTPPTKAVITRAIRAVEGQGLSVRAVEIEGATVRLIVGGKAIGSSDPVEKWFAEHGCEARQD